MPCTITISGLERNIGSTVILLNRKDGFGFISGHIWGELCHEDDPAPDFAPTEHTGTGRLVVMYKTFSDMSGTRYIPHYLRDKERIRIRYEPKSPKERTREIDYVVDLR